MARKKIIIGVENMITIEADYDFKKLGKILIKISEDLERNDYIIKRDVREEIYNAAVHLIHLSEMQSNSGRGQGLFQERQINVLDN